MGHCCRQAVQLAELPPLKGVRGMIIPPKVGGWGFAIFVWRAVFAPTLRLPTAGPFDSRQTVPYGSSFGDVWKRSLEMME